MLGIFVNFFGMSMKFLGAYEILLIFLPRFWIFRVLLGSF